MKSPTAFPMQEHEQALLERVRSGDASPHALVLFLQPYVACRAIRFSAHRVGPEWCDLASAANVAMLERLERAVTRENPFAYLLTVARYAMIDSFRSLYPRDAPILLSLDVPAREGEEPLVDTLVQEIRLEASDAQYERERLLLQHLALLHHKQRQVILRHYGLGEYAPEPLTVISKDLSTSARSTVAHYQHKRALDTLRFLLAASFPQYDAGGVQ